MAQAQDDAGIVAALADVDRVASWEGGYDDEDMTPRRAALFAAIDAWAGRRQAVLTLPVADPPPCRACAETHAELERERRARQIAEDAVFALAGVPIDGPAVRKPNGWCAACGDLAPAGSDSCGERCPGRAR